jgi:hypothetical protein
VVGRFDRAGEKLIPATTHERRGKGGSMAAGEYWLSPEGSNQVFCFEVF